VSGAGWRLIRAQAFDGAMNMALDEVLLQRVQAGISPPVVRLYRWRNPTLSLGYSQRKAEQYNLSACRQHGVEVVRRLTGGRAVLHDDELTYAVISNHQGHFSGTISHAYEYIAQVLLDALAALGLDAKIAARHAIGRTASRVEQSACFTAPAQFEIICAGKKICGSSQKRTRHGFLQHGSLPLNMDLLRLFLLLNTDSSLNSTEGVERLAAKIGWINRYCQPPCTIEQLEDALIHAFCRRWPVDFVEKALTADELQQAAVLAQRRYHHLDWPLQPGVLHAE
jgi:lipoate-protein ligase A